MYNKGRFIRDIPKDNKNQIDVKYSLTKNDNLSIATN